MQITEGRQAKCMLDVRLQQLAVAICIGFSLTVWWVKLWKGAQHTAALLSQHGEPCEFLRQMRRKRFTPRTSSGVTVRC